MLRIFGGTAQIILFALAGLAVLMFVYPLQSGTAFVVLLGLYLFGLGIQREKRAFLATLRRAGWGAIATGRGRHEGANIIATRRGVTLAVQCSPYAGRAGTADVQQIAAVASNYGTQFAVVVCPGGFTRAAEQCAHSNDVLLMRHLDLPRLSALLPQEKPHDKRRGRPPCE